MTDLLNLEKETPLLDLNKVAPALKKLRGVLEWPPNDHLNNNPNEFDLDIFVYVLNQEGKITGASDVVYFKNKHASGFSVPRDNQNGQGEKDEELFVTFDQIPADKHAAAIFIFIHKAIERRQTFGLIKNATFTLFDDETQQKIQAYRLTDMADQTVVYIGNLERETHGWTFHPIGQGSTKDPNQVASGYIKK